MQLLCSGKLVLHSLHGCDAHCTKGQRKQLTSLHLLPCELVLDFHMRVGVWSDHWIGAVAANMCALAPQGRRGRPLARTKGLSVTWGDSDVTWPPDVLHGVRAAGPGVAGHGRLVHGLPRRHEAGGARSGAFPLRTAGISGRAEDATFDALSAVHVLFSLCHAVEFWACKVPSCSMVCTHLLDVNCNRAHSLDVVIEVQPLGSCCENVGCRRPLNSRACRADITQI